MPNLTGTESMEDPLVELIYASGLHLVSDAKATKDIWIRLNKEVFVNGEFLPFKEEHYKADEYRKRSRTSTAI